MPPSPASSPLPPPPAPSPSVLSPPPPFYGALFMTKAGLDVTVYVMLGTSPAFAYDPAMTWSGFSVKFSSPFSAVQILASYEREGLQAYDNAAGGFVGFTKIGTGDLPSFASGKVATVSFPAGTDMDSLAIDYTDPQKTYIEVSPAEQVKFSEGQGPAFMVLSGESETDKLLTVFAPESYLRQVSVGFTSPVAGLVDASEYVAATGETVSTDPGGSKIGFAVFGGNFLLPTATAIALLEFSAPMTLEVFDTSSTDTIVEGEDYALYSVTIVDAGGSLFGKDPCAACTHYESNGYGDFGEVASYTAAGKCTRGSPAFKYVAKGSTTAAMLSNGRMQLGSTNPVPNAQNQDRWGFQVASECYTQDEPLGTTDATKVYRCTMDVSDCDAEDGSASGGSAGYGGGCSAEWSTCLVLPSSPPN